MQIDFTAEEYRLLLDLIFIGNWIAEDSPVATRENKEKYKKIIRKLYSYAERFDCGDLIAYDKKSDTFCERSKLEDKNLETVNGYNEESFWYMLVLNFAQKDIRKNMTEEEFKSLSEREQMDLTAEYGDKWNKIFADSGLNKLELKEE